MNLVLFEDRHVARLAPAVLARPAYAITCGALRLIDALAGLEARIVGVVRPHLAAMQEADFPSLHAPSFDSREPTVLVNARLVPSRAAREMIGLLARERQPGAVRHEGSLVAAVLPRESAAAHDAYAPPAGLTTEGLDAWLAAIGAADLPPLAIDLPETPLFHWPHDILRHHLNLCGEGLAHRLESGVYREIADGVFAAAGAQLGQHVVCDTKQGPVLLDRGASVGPYCLLRGPAYLGPNCRVIEHAAIKDCVALGHTTKIGGEVEASIIEPYTNKQHHGFLGHSYLGSWINLGAGTCNSDLKNTYGEVKMDYAGQRVATGMQFLGCIAGDYAKSAINTGVFTGKTIGACSMLYGFVTTNVPSFTNYARLFGQVTELSPDVMVATQQRMFLRRHVQQRPLDAQLIHDMYALTRSDRQIAGEPLHL